MIRVDVVVTGGGDERRLTLFDKVTPSDYKDRVAPELRACGATPEDLEAGYEAVHVSEGDRRYIYTRADGLVSVAIEPRLSACIQLASIGSDTLLRQGEPMELGGGLTARVTSMRIDGVNPLETLI